MTKRLLAKPKRLPDYPSQPRPRAMWLVARDRCAKCEARWEDVRFFGLPPSALCRHCPHVSEWTGKPFDGFA